MLTDGKSYTFSLEGCEKGSPKFELTRIKKLFLDGKIINCNALATTSADAEACWGRDCTFVDLYAYAKCDVIPNAKAEVVWGITEGTLGAVTGYRPLHYSTGEQIKARAMRSLFEPLENGLHYTFVAYGKLNGKKDDVIVRHFQNMKAIQEGKEPQKMDWIMGLSELRYRIDAGNIQDNSVLVITYRGEEYQRREYVLVNAIRKGFNGNDLKVLADLLGTGKVAFAGNHFYVGCCEYEPRELTVAEMGLFQMEAGRDPDNGICVAEEVLPRVEQYLWWKNQERAEARDARLGFHQTYRFDENESPIKAFQ